ncbi:MAG TPA: hypothetical protein VFV99_27290 [Kofleriaceae bacterium]|nr:hypothetical protein [Kofleriaceae bacterium]
MRTLALILLLAACDAGEKPAPPAPSPTPKKIPTAQSVPDAKYLPADSDLVVKLDLAALRRAKLWTTYGRQVSNLIVPGFSQCDYDPLAAARSIVIGIPLESQRAVYVVRGTDRNQAIGCLRTSAAVKLDGDFFTVTKANGNDYVFTFVDDTTMVMQAWQGATKQTLQRALAADVPTGDPAFAMMMARIAGAAPIAIASRPGSKTIEEKAATSGIRPQEMYGTLTLTDGLHITYATVFKTKDEATQFANLMDAQLEQTKTYWEATAQAQGNTTTMSVAMTEAQVTSMVNLLEPMLNTPPVPPAHTPEPID